MKKQKYSLLVISLGLISLLLVACASATTAKSNFPTGKFVLPDNENEGVYFNKDGTWKGFSGSMTLAAGTYHVNGDLYTEEANPDTACPTSATYRYTFDGTNLKFTLVGEDSCKNRRESLDGQTYVLWK